MPTKKLIEVALPLEAINKASAREKSIRHGHPSTLHLWWARRPLAAARAVIFAQMVDDPSSRPDLFPTEKAQEKERQRLFRIIEDLVQWENTSNQRVLTAARDEIWQSWRSACAEFADHSRARELFDRNILPAFHDPFAGGGAIPLEAQRLGLASFASDLNPVAVLINKGMVEIPSQLSGLNSVNPEARRGTPLLGGSGGPNGLAEDVRYYGRRLRDRAAELLGNKYPKIKVTPQMVKERPELKPLAGRELTVIAWIWARTVRSPDPAFSGVHVPLASTFTLASKAGTEAYVEPVVDGRKYRFRVVAGKPRDTESAKNGTKLGRANFQCLVSRAPIPAKYIRDEGKEGRLGTRLMAIVVEGDRKKLYLSPTPEHESVAREVAPKWKPDVEFFQDALGFRVGNYGLTKWSDLFTERQVTMLATIAELIADIREEAEKDAIAAGMPSGKRLEAGGNGAAAYADAIAVYLGFALSRMADRHSALCRWDPNPSGFAAKIANTFGRQALSMIWDFAEGNPFSPSSGNLADATEWVSKVIETSLPAKPRGVAAQLDAARQEWSTDRVISTDPPYYDNIGYADLSDFFYVWLRHALRPILPGVFGTVSTPKSEELVATPNRHGGKKGAEEFFLVGMTQAMHRIAEQAHPAFPVTIYYAFKQSEAEGEAGSASTGWETFLEAVISAGFALTGTWPTRTELGNRMRGMESNALASSVVLVCRPRRPEAPTVSRREFVAALKAELPAALATLQRGNIAPVDLAQAAIGPGMAVYTRYQNVLNADGQRLRVRDALALINQTLDEALAEQEGDFDRDSQWALAWFGDHGFEDGPFGDAHTYFLRFNTAENALTAAGIIRSGRGKVRLLRPEELERNWDPASDGRLTAWEAVHHLIRTLQEGGETAAAALVSKLGANADVARELAYRLYSLCERKKRAPEATAYNGLVQSWPEISRLAREGGTTRPPQGTLFNGGEE